jgi:hypothetical protein
VELRILVAAAGILAGLAILLAGVRVLGLGDPRSSALRRLHRRAGPQSSVVSGAAFIIVGVLLIVLSVQAIAQARHEMRTMVKPTATLRLDTPQR